MFRLVHTADWHLGHHLARHRRGLEHDVFLGWLLDLLEKEAADALLVCGDVFDTANPSPAALRRFYGFLAAVRARLPRLEVVVIGGNHDAPARLEAAGPLLDAAGVHVIGALPAPEHRGRAVIPLRDREGVTRAWCLAVPYLRMVDLPPDLDPAEGVRVRYDEVAAIARAYRTPDQALVVMGHGYLSGTRISELSERKVLGGGQHALPTRVFPTEASYIALGHLHLAQEVGRPAVRYSGSPLPLSMAERDYRHQVVVVDLEGSELAAIREVPTPRPAEMLIYPDPEGGPLERVLPLLAALPEARASDVPEDLWPLLEIRVTCAAPTPGLRDRVEEALVGRAVRLVRLQIVKASDGVQPMEISGETLADLQPEEVFRRRWASSHEGDLPPALAQAFQLLLEQVHQERS